jgi:hypothetical protein
MTKPRHTMEYRDDCKSFVDFAIENCIVHDGKIYCPCKMYRLNRRHLPSVVYSHLIGGKCILPTYKNWMFHGEKPGRDHVEPPPSNRLTTTDAAGGSSDHGGNMHAMLRDVFSMHDVGAENREP